MSIFYQHGCQAALTKLGFNEDPSAWDRIRKAGPAVGGLSGLLAGALMARRRPGHLAKHLLGGFGTGATIGWAPDIMASGYEALKG